MSWLGTEKGKDYKIGIRWHPAFPRQGMCTGKLKVEETDSRRGS